MNLSLPGLWSQMGVIANMDFSVLGLWAQMGFIARSVVIILIIMSIYAIGLTVERFITFRKGRSQSLGYIGALQAFVTTPGRLKEAAGLEQRWKSSPLARVIGTGIGEFARGAEAAAGSSDPADLELVVDGASRAMERVKEREISNLKRGLSILATISSSAPFVGLFGTVFGIITAFQQMADPTKGGGGGLATVSAGIAEALLTTAVGLGVAIVSVWFYNLFVSKVDDIVLDIDETAGEVLETMIREGRMNSAAVSANR